MNTPESFIQLLTDQVSNEQKIRILKGDFTSEQATAQIRGENTVDKLMEGMTFLQLVIVYDEIRATLRNMSTTLRRVHLALDIANNQAIALQQSDTEDNTKKSDPEEIGSTESPEPIELESDLQVLSEILGKVIILLNERTTDTHQ